MRRGMTIVEALVVVGVIGFLILLLLPAVQQARTPSNRSMCSNNLKQIGIAIHTYHDAFNEFPSGAIGSVSGAGQGANEGMWGWAVLIMPQMEQKPLWENIAQPDQNLNTFLGNSTANRHLLETSYYDNRCPSDSKARDDNGRTLAVRKLRVGGTGASVPVAWSSYVGCIGASDLPGPPNPRSGFFAPNSRRTFADIKDGLASTIMAGERAAATSYFGKGGNRAGVWLGYTSPNPTDDDGLSAIMGSTQYRIHDGNGGEAQPNVNQPTLAYSSEHAGGGATMLYADGAVGFMSKTVNFSTADQTNPPTGPPGVFNRLGMIADGLGDEFEGFGLPGMPAGKKK